MPIIGMLFFLLVIPFGLLIGSAILRGAVSLANKRLGPPPESKYIVEDEDDWGDYPIAGQQPERTGGVIPTPSIGGGMLMMLAIMIVNGIVTFVFQMMMDDNPGGGRGRLRGPLDDMVITRLLSLPIGFFLMSGLLAVFLPTSFTRSCLVALYYFLICLGIAAVLMVPLGLLWILGAG